MVIIKLVTVEDKSSIANAIISTDVPGNYVAKGEIMIFPAGEQKRIYPIEYKFKVKK